MRIEHVELIDSTNAELLRRPFGAVPREDHALIADCQSAGRGRNGRVWMGEPGASLALSVAVERRAGAVRGPGLPLALGVVIAETLESLCPPSAASVAGRRIGLKWPNDFILASGKLGGLLVQVRTQADIERTVMGLGLNLCTHAGIAAAAGQPVAFLSQLFGPHGAHTPPAAELALALAPALASACREHAEQGLVPWIERWRARDVLAARPIRIVESNSATCNAIAAGIDAQGFLIAHTDAGTRRVVSADVSVRLA